MNLDDETAVDIFQRLGLSVGQYHDGLATVGEDQHARTLFLLTTLDQNGLRLTLDSLYTAGAHYGSVDTGPAKPRCKP
jgi:hypothetical protein